MENGEDMDSDMGPSTSELLQNRQEFRHPQAAGFGCRRTGLPAIVILNLKELVHPWHIDT